MCPPGEIGCPDHYDCYVPCQTEDLFATTEKFMTVENSRYNGAAKCERFCKDETQTCFDKPCGDLNTEC